MAAKERIESKENGIHALAPGQHLRRNPDISCSARNANSPERRLEVGFVVAKTLKAD